MIEQCVLVQNIYIRKAVHWTVCVLLNEWRSPMKKYWMLESFHEQILSNRLISRLETQQSWRNIQNKVLIDLKIWKFLCQEYKRDGCWVLKEFRKSVDCRLGGQAKYTCVENPGSTRHFTGGLTVRVNTDKSGGV